MTRSQAMLTNADVLDLADGAWREPLAGTTFVYRVWANALVGFDCMAFVAWPIPDLIFPVEIRGFN